MDPLALILLIAFVAMSVLMILLLVMVVNGRKVKLERDAIEGEEQRMFGFLHLLGQAIEEDYTPRKLYRVIVDGIEEVVGADGAALYLMSQDETFFVPAHLSDVCPPLFELPPEKWEELKADRGALTSYLRLAKVPIAGGLLERTLKAGEGLRGASLPHGRPGGEDEVLLAPVRHGGRDLGVIAVVARNHRFSENDFDVFRSLAEQSSFALGNSLIHQEAAEKRRLDRELRLASDVQRVLLPATDPEPTGFRIHGTNVPARIISGDYYDYVPLPGGQLGVAIADVSGKGVSAGLMMATCRSALRSLAEDSDSPSAALAAVNRQLFSDMREDMFISMVYLILEDDSGKLRMARAGHEAPLMFRKESGEIELLKPGGLAIGIDEGPVFERVTNDFESEFASGDCLLLYTDGVNEAENEAGEEFGKERLRELFRKRASEGAEAAVAALQREVHEFAGAQRQMDDITLIAIEKR